MKFTILVQPYMRSRNEKVGLAGASSSRFSKLLERLIEQMKFADENGFHAMCMTEQHLQIEGIEVSTNPLLYGLYVAQHTKNLHVGQLGIPVTAHNPIKVAEDLAMADHFTNGRFFCGFSRGNTPRWAETFSQHLHIGAATSDKSEKDKLNRKAFEESIKIIKRLWTEDAIQFDGEFWKVPTPKTYWKWPPTDEWGTGVDENYNLQKIGIVPRPLQQPHPPIYAPFAFSMESARFWAREGGKLVSFVPDDKFIQITLDVYLEEAKKSGRENIRPADAIALGGHLIMGKNDAHTEDLYQGFEELYNLAYNVPPYHVPMGRLFKGSKDQVVDQIGTLHEKFDIDEFVLWHHVGYFSQEEELGMLELFADGIIKQLNR
jgi:alkanesulfonate monooxygenase SsuD/methylene tetrahydromethanopterin reductase-like flavin-dependent oxidoreductase (luciferase family)